MTTTAQRPTCWLAICVSLLVVSVAGWSLCRAGDARFVGKWAYWPAGWMQPFGEVHFEWSGSGRQTDRYSGGEAPLEWRTRENRLILTYRYGEAGDRDWAFEIVEPNKSIRLRSEGDWMLLVRIPK
jgi:hypothetical protein